MVNVGIEVILANLDTLSSLDVRSLVWLLPSLQCSSDLLVPQLNNRIPPRHHPQATVGDTEYGNGTLLGWGIT